jgi:hypothetical protein
VRHPPGAPGQGKLEYALVAVGAAIAVVLAIYALGPRIASMFAIGVSSVR